MIANQHIWREWTITLHRWGVNDVVATFLETAGPITILGAQMVYIAQPLLRGMLSSHHLLVLAEVLEDSGKTRAFVTYLREESPD